MERVIFDSDLYIDWINVGSPEELILGRWFLRLAGGLCPPGPGTAPRI